MSESDGMDEVLDGGMRQSLMIASRIAETLARRRQESQRQQEHQDAQAAHEAQARLTADRSAAHAALAPVNKDQWWAKAQPQDIATAHAVAEDWKDHDPTALTASEKIRQEAFTRYGIDTHDVGADAAYLESVIQTVTTEKARQDALDHSQEETRKAATEHEKAMGLLAAARAEELRAQAVTLAPEMERHQVPAEYLANPELAEALQTVHTAAGTHVPHRQRRDQRSGHRPAAERDHREHQRRRRLPLQGSRVREAAKDMHEAKLLAEGGFKGSERTTVDQRHERAETELFARMQSVGREIENRVTGTLSRRLRDQGLKTESTSAGDYGSAEGQEAFAASLATTGANETQIQGRAAAERSEGTHPSAAVTMGKGATKAKRTRTGAAVGAERANSDPAR